MIKTDIYIGLNDRETKEQKFDTSKYIDVLKHVCKSYQIPFSFNVVQGGYMHESGEYTEENTLVLSLIDIDKKTVNEIAEDFCMFFNQESVLITSDLVRTYSIKRKEEEQAS